MLEIILAVSLSLLLLAALYSVLKLHLTYSQKAPEQVRQAQLARAIVDRIARDIRAIIPPVALPTASPDPSSNSETANTSTTQSPNTSGNTTSGTTGSTTSSTGASSDASSSTSDIYRTAYGVLGGSDWLQLYIADNYSSVDDVEMAATSGSVAQTTNLVRVTYALALLSTTLDSKGRTQRLALARSEVATIGAERMDLSADDSDLRATTLYLSDDLASIQFQYWDDVTLSWVDSWGVDVPIAPPRAIKVLISLQDPDEFLADQLGTTGGLSTWEPVFQMVIPVPTWSPEAEYAEAGLSEM